MQTSSSSVGFCGVFKLNLHERIYSRLVCTLKAHDSMGITHASQNMTHLIEPPNKPSQDDLHDFLQFFQIH